jgi:outer membrane protein OmpU
MKPILYSTTVLAAAGLLAFGVGEAAAQTQVAAAHAKKKGGGKVNVGVGGFFLQTVGYNNQEGAFETANTTDLNKFHLVASSEVYFRGNTKLDNGIRVDVIIQLETDQVEANDGTVIDESYLKFTGGFGDLRIGSTKQALFVLKHRAPTAGTHSHDAGSKRDWVIRPFAQAVSGTNFGPNDSMKIAYFTPRFGGFGIGVSHTPDLTNSDAPGDHVAGDSSQTDAIVTFERKLGDVDVKADVGWNHDHGGAADNTGWRTGINLGFAGFTIGGAYLDQEGDIDAAGLVSLDGNGWDMGISYKSGPWTAAVAYMETEETATINDPDNTEMTTLHIGGQYNIGPGISLRANVQITEYTHETTAAAKNNEGWAAVAGIKVSF